MSLSMERVVKGAVVLAAAASGLAVASLAARPQPAHALPEYADRTGEACATCHVSPGGGGPRTLRGLLWTARGRPDAVPELPDVLLAPGVTDPVDLYEVACAACHGPTGEGLFGTALADSRLREAKIRSSISRGKRRSGMPAFAGQLTDDQLTLLVSYVADLAANRVEPAPPRVPAPPGRLTCQATSGRVAAVVRPCGAN